MPSEIAITDRREAELAKNGLMPLSHWKNTDYAVFIGAQTLHKPAEYDDPDATANDNLGSRLPYLFASCRFAHYLKSIMRDKIGSFMTRKNAEDFLTKWIAQYILLDPDASQEMKAAYPLSEARIDVVEVPGKPGAYRAVAYHRPHYQLDEISVSLRLVAELPPPAKG